MCTYYVHMYSMCVYAGSEEATRTRFHSADSAKRCAASLLWRGTDTHSCTHARVCTVQLCTPVQRERKRGSYAHQVPQRGQRKAVRGLVAVVAAEQHLREDLNTIVCRDELLRSVGGSVGWFVGPLTAEQHLRHSANPAVCPDQALLGGLDRPVS